MENHEVHENIVCSLSSGLEFINEMPTLLEL